jgi:type IV pilus assembly protein PilA
MHPTNQQTKSREKSLAPTPKHFDAGAQSALGFTLIEILVVMGIIAVLAAIVLIAINPARQFAQARNSQRTSNVQAILNAIGQNMADHAGILTCDGTAFDMSTIQGNPTASGDYVPIDDSNADLAPCLVPDYIAALPFDPSDQNAQWTDETDYNTGYTIVQDSSNKRLTVRAPSSELDLDDNGTPGEFTDQISITR